MFGLRFNPATFRPALLLLALALAGCVSPQKPAAQRPFTFAEDTFAFANELVWEYSVDETGKQTHRRKEPPPDYTHHCFVMARSARQFWQSARFDPDQPRADDARYREAIRRIAASNPRHPPREQVLIPGFANLREFSSEYESLLKENLGGAWRSYVQRGHWRLVFPFTRNHQEKTAASLLDALHSQGPPVVHLVRFPQLTINHAVVVFDALSSESGIRFLAYDPNNPTEPVPLDFARQTRTFTFPQNDYFAGGRVDVYQVYHNCCY